MCQRSASVHASTTSRSVCVGLRTAWSIMLANSGTVGSSTGRPVCSEDAGLVARRSPLRDRYSHPRFVDPDLLPRSRVPIRVDLPGSVPAVVAPEDVHRLGRHGAALLRLDTRARTRTFAGRAALPDVSVVDHAVPAWWRREPHERAAIGESGVLHGCGRS